MIVHIKSKPWKRNKSRQCLNCEQGSVLLRIMHFVFLLTRSLLPACWPQTGHAPWTPVPSPWLLPAGPRFPSSSAVSACLSSLPSSVPGANADDVQKILLRVSICKTHIITQRRKNSLKNPRDWWRGKATRQCNHSPSACGNGAGGSSTEASNPSTPTALHSSGSLGGNE